jgi:hypothetical protein
MPHAIHEAALKKQMHYNSSRPQEAVPEVLPENWTGTPQQGLPVLQIPHFEFPLCLYMHPLVPARKVIHRNDRQEVVHEELVPLEHLTKVVGCEAHIKSGGPRDCPDCNASLEAALAEGWVKEPYIPKPAADENLGLYGPRKKKN